MFLSLVAEVQSWKTKREHPRERRSHSHSRLHERRWRSRENESMTIISYAIFKIQGIIAVDFELLQAMDEHGFEVDEQNNVTTRISIQRTLDQFENYGNGEIKTIHGSFFVRQPVSLLQYKRENGRFLRNEKQEFYHAESRFYVDLINGLVIITPGKFADEFIVALHSMMGRVNTASVVTTELFTRIELPLELIQDYSKQWKTVIKKTGGYVRTGIFYGQDISNDEDFGEGVTRSVKNSLGLYTRYFTQGDTDEKFAVTRACTFSFYSEKSFEAVIRFYLEEIQSFIEARSE